MRFTAWISVSKLKKLWGKKDVRKKKEQKRRRLKLKLNPFGRTTPRRQYILFVGLGFGVKRDSICDNWKSRIDWAQQMA